MSAPVPLKYRAFLSYAHADLRWGKWLHGQLEGFRIDKDLAGRTTPMGPVPKTLRPIFRDREDFAGGHTLTEATIAALDQNSFDIAVIPKTWEVTNLSSLTPGASVNLETDIIAKYVERMITLK